MACGPFSKKMLSFAKCANTIFANLDWARRFLLPTLRPGGGLLAPKSLHYNRGEVNGATAKFAPFNRCCSPRRGMQALVLDLVKEQSKAPRQTFFRCPVSCQKFCSSKRGLLARDLAEENSTALKQNPVWSPVPLSKKSCRKKVCFL